MKSFQIIGSTKLTFLGQKLIWKVCLLDTFKNHKDMEVGHDNIFKRLVELKPKGSGSTGVAINNTFKGRLAELKDVGKEKGRWVR